MRTPLAILTLLALGFCDVYDDGDSGCGGVVTEVWSMDYVGVATTTAATLPSDILPASEASTTEVDATVDIQFDGLSGSTVAMLVNTADAATSGSSESFSTVASLASCADGISCMTTSSSSSSYVTTPTAAPFFGNWSFNSTNRTTITGTGTGITPLPTSLAVFKGTNKSSKVMPPLQLLPVLLIQAVAICLI